MKHFIAACAVSCAGLVASVADAATFAFSFTDLSGGVLSGQLTGTIDPADSNAVVVSSVFDVAYNGVAGPLLPVIQSASTFLNVANTDPVLSFDGTNMDFTACADATCFNGFAFIGSVQGSGTNLMSSGPNYGGNYEAFDTANWTMTAVPLPASGLVLLGALASFGAMRRRAKAV